MEKEGVAQPRRRRRGAQLRRGVEGGRGIRAATPEEEEATLLGREGGTTPVACIARSIEGTGRWEGRREGESEEGAVVWSRLCGVGMTEVKP